MSDREWTAPDDYENLLRSPSAIAADPQGPTPNELAAGLGTDHPAATAYVALPGFGEAGRGLVPLTEEHRDADG